MRQNLRLQPYQTVIDLNRYFSERHTMNQTVINYHKQRRPFIIIPETGLILGETGQPFSHREILSRCGLDDEQVKYVLENYPRGYFLDNKLVIYQREDVEEGSCWELKPENYFYVRKYFPDLKRIFGITRKTRIFLGVLRGKEGELWPTINETGIEFFE